MKKTTIIVLLSLAVLLVATLPFSAKAGASDLTGNVYIKPDQIIDDNLVRAGNNFDIQGTIKGDVIVAGTSIDITGKVEGDVIAAAGIIKIGGEVMGDVRVAGGTVEFNGKVAKNVNVFSGIAQFNKGSEIGGDIGFGTGTAEFRGEVKGKIDGGSGSVIIAGTINDSVNLRYDTTQKQQKEATLKVFSTAVVASSLDYTSYIEAEIEEGATINGEITRHVPTGVFKNVSNFLDSFWWFTRIVGLFGLFVLGLVIVSLFKKESNQVAELMLKSSGKSILLGLVILILTPIISFILLFTIIGLPLAIVMMLIYGIAIYISTVFVGLVIGRKLLAYFQNKQKVNTKDKKEPSLFWSMILGILIYSLITDFLLGFGWQGVGVALGLLGGLIKFIVMLWALGAMFLMKGESIKESSK